EAAALLPLRRWRGSPDGRVVAHFEKSEEALEFANSTWAADLCRLGTSCPDHFLRTRISPMFVAWDPAADDGSGLIGQIDDRLADYRQHYAAYYTAYAQPDSPRMRSANPSVVVVPALGGVGFGKDKREARITTEFFLNAVHVMAGATALEDGASTPERVPQARRPEQANDFTSFHNYVALPRSEAFRIEYWALEEAKLQRLPPEREFSRQVALVVGGGSGTEVARELARRGAHVAVAAQTAAAAEATWADARALSSADMGIAVTLDLMDRNSIAAAVRQAVLQFGGLDSIVNTAAIYPTP